VHPRLIAVPFVVTLAGCLVGGLTGCNSVALSRRELVVVFQSSATDAQHAAALQACTGVAARTSPEPILPSTHRVARTADVRFRIDHADDRDIAQLEACLGRQPGVLGFQDSNDLNN
jgi:hypothetical protein